MRCQVAEGGVFSVEVVVGDVLADLTPGGSMMFVFGHFEFCLERSKTRFHEGIVITVAGAVHALSGACPAEDGTITAAGILTSSIRVVNQIWFWLSFSDGGLECGNHQFLRHHLIQMPANDPP